MKKMLLVYPHNFLQGGMGTNNRVYALVKIFKEIGFQIDYFGFEHLSDSSSFAQFDSQNSEGLINNLYIYDFWQSSDVSDKQTISFLKKVYSRIKKGVTPQQDDELLHNWIQPNAKALFDDILSQNNYDVIILFYTFTANLLKNSKTAAKKVYFMEDFQAIQQYSWKKEGESVDLGHLIGDEINRLKLFDEYFCISYDEKVFFEKVLNKQINFCPYLDKDKIVQVTKKVSERKWDITFVGYDNPFNIEGMRWFLDKVYPLLRKDIRLAIVGKVTNHLEIRYSNVDFFPFVPDLDEIYNNTKISICPMMRGTGMKVKVVEAISRGLPVVCTERGVDGFPDKTKSGCLVTNAPEEFAGFINQLVNDHNFYNKVVKNIGEYYSQVFDANIYINSIKKILLS